MIASSHLAVWAIALTATAGVIVRPFRIPEFWWAVAGAGLLVIVGLMNWRDAVAAAREGTDVYLFLVGMMLLAEIARQNGLFDAMAARGVTAARGSSKRLFLIVYAVGTIVTVFLSNDATAVVLTPAVYSVTRAAKVEPLPYLFVCAFIANAASFVLPISNPANLVVFGDRMPALLDWLRAFTLPSLAAILVTFAMLRWTQRRALRGEVAATAANQTTLSRGGWLAAFGIVATAAVLTIASTVGRDLGLPTFVCGVAAMFLVLAIERRSPLPILRHISWSVLPLVAGLFILVEALNRTGVLAALASALRDATASHALATAWASGVAVAVASNLVNNLPMGLMAATTAHLAQSPTTVTAAILIGVDLGPNLSVTGSLATILWLLVLRRENESVTAWQFLKVGAVVMPPALAAALLALMV